MSAMGFMNVPPRSPRSAHMIERFDDFAPRGPHPVGLVSLAIADPANPGRVLCTDVWFPTVRARRGEDLAPDRGAPHPFGQPHAAIPEAPPADGPFPLLVFSHGNAGTRRQSTFLTTHLASWGFVVAAPDHTGNTYDDMLLLGGEARRDAIRAARTNRPRDVSLVIDAIVAGDPRWPAVDGEQIGVLGHSFGGYTALKMPRRDARVRAVCGLAPAAEAFLGRKAFEPDELPFARPVPALIVAAVDDSLVDLDGSVRPLFARLAPPCTLHTVDDADHYHFCDGVEWLHGLLVRNPHPDQPRPARPYAELLPQARAHRIICALVTTFLSAMSAER